MFQMNGQSCNAQRASPFIFGRFAFDESGYANFQGCAVAMKLGSVGQGMTIPRLSRAPAILMSWEMRCAVGGFSGGADHSQGRWRWRPSPLIVDVVMTQSNRGEHSSLRCECVSSSVVFCRYASRGLKIRAGGVAGCNSVLCDLDNALAAWFVSPVPLYE